MRRLAQFIQCPGQIAAGLGVAGQGGAGHRQGGGGLFQRLLGLRLQPAQAGEQWTDLDISLMRQAVDIGQDRG